MKNFVLGFIAALGGLSICKKMYDKGYDEAMEQNKSKDSSKEKKTK